jgi:hypothetical protein
MVTETIFNCHNLVTTKLFLLEVQKHLSGNKFFSNNDQLNLGFFFKNSITISMVEIKPWSIRLLMVFESPQLATKIFWSLVLANESNQENLVT